MSLSQKEYGELRGLYESVYTPKVEITEELIDDIVDELVEELVEEGYSEEEAYSLVEEATDTYIDEAKVTFGHDTQATRKSGAPVGARRRYGMRKAGDAVKAAKGAASGAYKTAKAKAASAAVDVSLAGSMAKKKAGEVKQAVKDAPGKAKAAASDAKKKAKSGIKGFIKRQAQKVVKRMSEEMEAIEEDSRCKALRQEELEATGLFSEKEIEAIMEAEMIGEADTRPENINSPAHRDRSNEGLSDRQIRMKKFAQKRAQMALKKEEVEEVDEAMSSYDRNRKRAAQRAAARNAARDAGKTGVVPGVGYVTPRREKETYVDSAGTTRHKSGAKMEEVEAVDEGLTGERYKKAPKKGKMYSRMVSADPEKRATRGGRGGESDFGAGDRGTGNRSRRRRGMSVGDED